MKMTLSRLENSEVVMNMELDGAYDITFSFHHFVTYGRADKEFIQGGTCAHTPSPKY